MAAGHVQLNLLDLIRQVEEQGARQDDGGLGSLQRLGETSEFGYLLLDLLGLDGWEVVVTSAFAGGSAEAEARPGVLVIASRNGMEVKAVGDSVAAVACELFVEASKWRTRTGARPFEPDILPA